MMYNNFSNFILDLYAVDKPAAQWLATQCIHKKNGEPNQLRANWNPIVEWNRGFVLANFFHTEDSPYPLITWHEFWVDMKRVKREREEINAVPPPPPVAPFPPKVKFGNAKVKERAPGVWAIVDEAGE